MTKQDIEQAYDNLKQAHINEFELEQIVIKAQLEKTSAHKQTQLARQKVEELRDN